MEDPIQKILDISNRLDVTDTIRKSGNTYNIDNGVNSLEFCALYDEYFDCNRYTVYLGTVMVNMPESVGDYVLSRIRKVFGQQKSINIR